DDQKTFDLLKRGETTGVFQFESSGMKRYMKMLQPTELEDLIAMGALYRPGPLDAGMVEEYIERKNGKREVKYSHPKIEPALKDTYGVIVYQEQVMRIARDLAGFTMGQADTLRKAVGKKIKELMDKQQKLLVDGMTNNGVPKNTALEIWEQIETFARYGFNRSHAACYGMVSYITAYLKANYPPEYMAALLTSDLDDIDRIAVEINECRQMGIDVLLPDINESFTRFTVVAQSLAQGRPRIRFGLSGIKGVGENIARTIIRVRKEGGPFTSLVDLLTRVQSRDFNKKSLDSLIRSGALDSFGDRNTLLLNIDKILAFTKEQHALANQAQSSLFSVMSSAATPQLALEPQPKLDTMTLLSWEKELLGFYLSQHPFDMYKEALGDYVVDSSTLSKQKLKGHIRVAGIVTAMKKIVTKKGDLMMFVTLEDNKGLMEVIVFPSVYAQTAHIWQENTMVIVSGTASAKDETTKVLCNEVKILNKKDIPMLVAGMKKLNPEIETGGEVSIVIFFDKVVSAPTIDALSNVLHSKTGGKKVYLAVPIDSSKFRKIETNFLLDPHDTSILDKISKLSDVKYVKVM
ncbi:DNA polymerase III subunit alpha, partial [Candidatus Falkowbacteria bacterium]|nr:DNA polymerase III subunit alpha [Candidatus Falkowbacteria bacterium]